MRFTYSRKLITDETGSMFLIQVTKKRCSPLAIDVPELK